MYNVIHNVMIVYPHVFLKTIENPSLCAIFIYLSYHFGNLWQDIGDVILSIINWKFANLNN